MSVTEAGSLGLCLLGAGVTGELPFPSGFGMGAADLSSSPPTVKQRLSLHSHFPRPWMRVRLSLPSGPLGPLSLQQLRGSQRISLKTDFVRKKKNLWHVLESFPLPSTVEYTWQFLHPRIHHETLERLKGGTRKCGDLVNGADGRFCPSGLSIVSLQLVICNFCFPTGSHDGFCCQISLYFFRLSS